nr:SDR family oxidoreductase [Marinicella sp. W31]MDC2877756.1 SDR family oxidoreductase [Marinicella sp. W31]
MNALMAGHCDVTDPDSVEDVFKTLEQEWGKIDFVVHAIAFSDKDETDRALSRHFTREFQQIHGHFGLFLHRHRPARGTDHE